ncbi:putative membrane protein [Candidatus Erwinia dacicola]|uniref:Membrane protein n=1 Tax=Candidatus Erwinia dacicola TaxID=252393 RepID=A0A328TGE4_9GAMM|nr:putative membrane protein [Candidatus Erwinia dacicola]
MNSTALTTAWLLYFYTTFCGMMPIKITFIFAPARVLDAAISVVVN